MKRVSPVIAGALLSLVIAVSVMLLLSLLFAVPTQPAIPTSKPITTMQQVGAPKSASPNLSGTFILDYNFLQASKQKVLAKDPAYLKALDKLEKEAAPALATTKYGSVMEKSQVAASGDKHDYLSLGTYWWPDPAKPDGLPYIRKDGQANPENRTITDHKNLATMTNNVHSLALAYYFNQDEAYAKQAIKMLQVFFLDPATRMNPNLNYGQVLKGHNEGKGRGAGIVDTEHLVQVIDAIQLLKSSPSLTPTDYGGLQKWFGDYSNWLVTSENGKEIAASNNNITSLYELQVISYALFAGKTDFARQRFQENVIPRLATQFRANGEQPAELARTLPWTYSNKNLNGWFQLATVAQSLGIDLWNLESNGRSLKTAFRMLLGYALQPETWPYKELKGGIQVRYLVNSARTASMVWPDLREPIWQLLQKSHEDFVSGGHANLLTQPYHWNEAPPPVHAVNN